MRVGSILLFLRESCITVQVVESSIYSDDWRTIASNLLIDIANEGSLRGDKAKLRVQNANVLMESFVLRVIFVSKK